MSKDNNNGRVMRADKAYNVSSKNPNKFEEDYDPERDNRKYVVYRNDIKYKGRNNIDLSRAIFQDEEVENDFKNCDTDNIDYRIKDCIREKCELLDLAHMTADAFIQLFSHPQFDEIKLKIEVISANESDIEEVPDLRVFNNLISLNLSGNKLDRLPFLPHSLEELIIDDNEIEIVQFMPVIKRIRARNNRLHTIEYSNTLESMCLSNNPNLVQIVELPKLYHLEIKRTGITQIPICPNLKYLDIDETRIRVLPALDNLHILSCVRSKLSDISLLTTLYALVTTDSKIRQIHYMPTLQKLTFNSIHQNEIRLSSRYKAHRMYKNKNDIIDMVFTANPIPVKIMN
jgi:hypothetical protein